MPKIYISPIVYPNTTIKHKCIHCLRLLPLFGRHRKFKCELGENIDYGMKRVFKCEYFQPKQCVSIVKNKAVCDLEKLFR